MGQYFGAETGPGRMHCGGTWGLGSKLKFGSKLTMRPTFVEAKATTARCEKGSIPTAYGKGSTKAGLAGLGCGMTPLRSTVANNVPAGMEWTVRVLLA